jgi:hypothetical protein
MFGQEVTNIIYYIIYCKSTIPTTRNSSVLTTAVAPQPSHRQSPLTPAGKTEISAALVQPLPQIACKEVKRK